METEPQHHQTALQQIPRTRARVFTAKPGAWALQTQNKAAAAGLWAWQNSPATNLPLPGCVPAALLCSGVAALRSRGRAGERSRIFQGKRRARARTSTGAQAECYSHSLHPSRGYRASHSQLTRKIRRDSDMLQHAVINETAIYVIISMQSTLGPISSRKLMTLYSAVQH